MISHRSDRAAGTHLSRCPAPSSILAQPPPLPPRKNRKGRTRGSRGARKQIPPSVLRVKKGSGVLKGQTNVSFIYACRTMRKVTCVSRATSGRLPLNDDKKKRKEKNNEKEKEKKENRKEQSSGIIRFRDIRTVLRNAPRSPVGFRGAPPRTCTVGSRLSPLQDSPVEKHLSKYFERSAARPCFRLKCIRNRRIGVCSERPGWSPLW